MVDTFYDVRRVTVTHDRVGKQVWETHSALLPAWRERNRTLSSAIDNTNQSIASLLRPEPDDMVLVEHRVPLLADVVGPLEDYREAARYAAEAESDRKHALVEVVSHIVDAGVPYRDAGMLLGLSHQAAAELIVVVNEAAEDLADEDMMEENREHRLYAPLMPPESFDDTLSMALLPGDGYINEQSGVALAVDYTLPLDADIPAGLRPRRAPEDEHFRDAPPNRADRLAWAESLRDALRRRRLVWPVGDQVAHILDAHAAPSRGKAARR